MTPDPLNRTGAPAGCYSKAHSLGKPQPNYTRLSQSTLVLSSIFRPYVLIWKQMRLKQSWGTLLSKKRKYSQLGTKCKAKSLQQNRRDPERLQEALQMRNKVIHKVLHTYCHKVIHTLDKLLVIRTWHIQCYLSQDLKEFSPHFFFSRLKNCHADSVILEISQRPSPSLPIRISHIQA